MGRSKHTCPVTGKVKYTSQLCARNAAYLINISNKETPKDGCRPYHCEHCEMWHIGHEPQHIKKAKELDKWPRDKRFK